MGQYCHCPNAKRVETQSTRTTDGRSVLVLHVHVVHRHAHHVMHLLRYLHGVWIAFVLRDEVVELADLARLVTDYSAIDLPNDKIPACRIFVVFVRHLQRHLVVHFHALREHHVVL